jgi:hypothetical protein
VTDWNLNPEFRHWLYGRADRDPRAEVWSSPAWAEPEPDASAGFSTVIEAFRDAPYYVICADQLLYHPDWFDRLLRACESAWFEGITGVFAALDLPAWPGYRPLHLPTGPVVLKARQPAANWLLPRPVYDAIGPFRGAGTDSELDYRNRLTSAGFPVICLSPGSVRLMDPLADSSLEPDGAAAETCPPGASGR